jgi:hypothetical protein
MRRTTLLTAAQQGKILVAYSRGVGMRELARKHGVFVRDVSAIVGPLKREGGSCCAPQYPATQTGGVKQRYFIGGIIKHAAEIWNVAPADIVGKRRLARFCAVRGAVVIIARELTELSTPQIGVVLGGRDHSTVINAARSAAQLAQSDPIYALNLATLRARTMDRPGDAAQLAEERKREIARQETERAEREAAIIAERAARREWLKAANGCKIRAAALRKRHARVAAVQSDTKAKNAFLTTDSPDDAHEFHAAMAEGSAKLLAKLLEARAA